MGTLYCKANNMEILSENILDPINKELSKDIFIKEIMRGKVKFYLIDTIIKWLKKMGYEKEIIKSIHLIGSSAGYQYNETSDIDVSVETDIPIETIKKIWRMLPNGNTLPETKHPVNYYLTSNLHDVETSDAAYNILKDTWVKKQKIEENIIPPSYALEIARFFIAGINDRLDEYNRDKQELEIYKKYNPEEQEIKQEEIDDLISKKENEIKADMDSIFIAHNIIKGFRKEAYDNNETNIMLDLKVKNSNNTINNIVYKTLEKFGYLDKMTEVVEERKKLLKK